MDTTTPEFTDPRLAIAEPGPNVPGVEFREANFASRGEGLTPFKGGQFKIAPGSTSRTDIHDVRECWMVVKGEGVLDYDGQEFRVTAGDFCYFEPQKSHRIHNDGDQDILIYNVWWG